MKIRTDFVSNSSSSSFMIIGDVFDDDQIKDCYAKKFPGAAQSDDCDVDDVYNMVDQLIEGTRLSYDRGIEKYYNSWVIGMYWNAMQNDETKKDFEARVKDELTKAFPGQKIEVKERVDGGYLG